MNKHDVAHLEPGMTVTIRWREMVQPQTGKLTTTDEGGLLLGGAVVCCADGTPGMFVAEIVDPAPPVAGSPVGTRITDGERRAIRASDTTEQFWLVYEGPDCGSFLDDDAVAGWARVEDWSE